MKRYPTLLRLCMLALTWFIGSPTMAATTGDPLPVFTLKTASGEKTGLPADTRRLYLSVDRKGGRLISEAMKGHQQDTLDRQRAVMVADISAAPGFVRGMIRGSFKDRPYQTLLDESGQTSQHLPLREDHITVVDLDQGVITQIRYLADVADLSAMLAEETVSGNTPVPTGD